MLISAAAAEAAFLLAQAAPMLPPPVVVTPLPETTLVIPWGSYVADFAAVIGVGLAAVATWAFRFVPSRFRGIMTTMQVDQLLVRAITFGVNSVAGASRDKVLSVDVSNRVLREALAYALLHGSAAVREFMGTPEAIAEKIWSRLNVAADSHKPDFPKVAAMTVNDVTLTSPRRAGAVDLVA